MKNYTNLEKWADDLGSKSIKILPCRQAEKREIKLGLLYHIQVDKEV